MSYPFTYGISPKAPEQSLSHPNRDSDTIIKLLKEIQKFMQEYIDLHIFYRVQRFR
jgi:hypothetical protein